MTMLRKKTFTLILAFIGVSLLAACSTNPATGERQFTALLPADREVSLGAQEHAKVEQTFGQFIEGPTADYVRRIGKRVAANTERDDVTYQFFVIDSPMVNAFAIPGGYVYVTRGLMALANNEAELAAVIGHEIAHITARHSAERVSQGFLAQLGAVVLATAVDSSAAARAGQLGSELYLKSYSRDQEHQADELGVRYLHHAHYDTFAMASFLDSMGRFTNLEAKIAGKQAPRANWFSTHPQTENRVAQASAEAAKYSAKQTDDGRNTYFNAINGMAYGDSAAQGFIREQTFYHTELNFTFTFPNGFEISNQPRQVVGMNERSGAIIVFDAAKVQGSPDPYAYLTSTWMKGQNIRNPEAVTVNGKRAATASFEATINGKRMNVQLMAVEWKPGQFYRFQVGIPRGLDNAALDALKKSTYSLRELTANERKTIKPYRIRVVTASSGQSVSSMASRMAVESHKEEFFRVLNGLKANETLKAGQKYKIITR